MRLQHNGVIVTILMLLLVSCSHEEEPQQLRLALQTEPSTLDPAFAVDYSSGLLSSLIHDNLVRFDEEGRIVPGLAGRREVSADGTVYTFNLVPARFSNGRSVKASDVVISFTRLLAPSTVSPRWWVLGAIRGAADFHHSGRSMDGALTAPDDTTVVIQLAQPTAHFLSMLSMPAAGIVCVEEVERLGEMYGRSPCGSGPWCLESWLEGDKLSLRRNPFYQGRAPAITGISFRIIPESMTRIAEFEVGNLDILEVPRAELTRWRSAGVSLRQQEELRIVYIGLNNRKSPFDNRTVRRALNMAIDIESIIVHLLFGAGHRAHGVIPPSLRKEPEPEGLYAYDPHEARRLLTEAGFPEGFAMEIWQRDNPESGRILESVQGYLAQVGITVKLVTREWSAFKQAINRGTPDAFYLDWFADYPDAENFIAPLFHSENVGGGGNRSAYTNAAVDSLIEEAARCPEENRRWELYRRAEELVYSDAPWIFLWFPLRYEVISPRVRGYRIPAVFTGQRFLEVKL
ncbi:MAG: ABC transporter substrate-binding protein [bacterium]|nr:MAG: ABC transporter substrate-binding protein [bacterium]